ncbi:MAG TPA: CRISPR-associated helicase Cas3', partial [Planctomycetaceae bacterium]|nr:CRISPR-associated helicase Cas3' [Planctomycetaceae bacterium]
MTEDSLFLLWGKLGKGRYPDESHPVLCHLLDVGSSCLRLWDTSLGVDSRQRWADALALNPVDAGRWIAFWAAAHDIGKISPCFQFKSADAKQRLKRLGFSSTSSRELPHATLSAIYLQDELVAPSDAAWQGISQKMASCVAAVVGGHHGLIPGSGTLRTGRMSLGAGKWENARTSMMRTLAEAFGVTSSDVPGDVSSASSGFWLFLAGLISVADWIGSNATFFQNRGQWAGADIDLVTYQQLSRQRAHDAVHRLGFDRWVPRKTGPLTFHAVHPDIAMPRPLQDCCVQIARTTTQPQLVLVEAPMGEGKTEAAVYLADHASHVMGCRGLYIALPTQATSNQMFDRIRKWLEQRYEVDDDRQTINLQLLHGRIGFSKAFGELLQLAEIDEHAGNKKSGRNDDKTPNPRVVAESWFAQNKKQQLLAPFGVGTIDQLLMAVLHTKHHFVRLFGLAAKTVILDEVHAYDAYMSTLMERLLQWLAGLGCPVILLSATLPSERRRRLIEAYTGCVVTIPPNPYPRVTIAKRNDSDVQSKTVETDPKRRVSIRLSWVEVDSIVAKLREILTDGGCVGIVCNTVTRAQDLFQTLAAEFELDGVQVSLFHARFPVAERMRVEGEVLASLGQPINNPQRPARSILVATQVIEQSLDLDFDLLISEVAPIDLILQRAGRLHRHSGRQRPPRLQETQLWLIEPHIDDHEIPDFGVFQSTVAENGAYRSGIYDRHILLRTWLTLRDELPENRVSLPDDLERLVESVYSASFEAATGDDVWQAELQRTHDGMRLGILHSEASAAAVRVPAPDADDLLEQCAPELDEDDPDVHRDLQALTRQGDPSITLVLLYEQSGTISLDSDGYDVVDLQSSSQPS